MAYYERRPIYANPSAKLWQFTRKSPAYSLGIVKDFHNSLPGFEATKLVSLDAVAREIGAKNVFVKDETLRWGLPSFKILGASWAVNRAIVKACNLPYGVGLDVLGAAARNHAVKLFAATDGNHGRAVAKMARVLGIEANIYVPLDLDQSTINLITSEGARLVVAEGDYDLAVRTASTAADSARNIGGILIQDTAFEGYEEVTEWIMDGYSTMLQEIGEQLDPKTPKIYVVPVGVGSLAQAVVMNTKSANHSNTVLSVEPHTAACLWASLKAGKSTTIETQTTIMSGMNCGTVSTTAWPILEAGLDASVTISDAEAHEAVVYLHSMGILAGPCGGAALAALKYVARTTPEAIRLTRDSTIILVCSEGQRDYQIPLKQTG